MTWRECREGRIKCPFGRLRDVERLGRAILLVLLGFLGVAGGVLTIRISVCTCVLLEQGDDDLINNMQ